MKKGATTVRSLSSNNDMESEKGSAMIRSSKDGLFEKVDTSTRMNKKLKSSIEVTDRRRNFGELSDLSMTLPKHKKKMKRKGKMIKIERPDPIRIDGSSPYAEYLPTRFRQYNPETRDFEKGKEAVIPGGFTAMDPDELMEANFGSARRMLNSKSSKRAFKATPSKGLNFYGNSPGSDFGKADRSDISHSEVNF
jgi:hypothetical protein